MKKSLLLALSVLGGLYLSGPQTPVSYATTGDVAKGKKIYLQNCATCHGKTGLADGPTGKVLNPKPRDFTKAQFKYAKTDAELVKFIQAGKGAMPGWKSTLSEAQIKDVLAFIHTLKKK